MFFLLWAVNNTLLHLAAAFLYADYKRNYAGEFIFEDILDEVRLDWTVIRERFNKDVFWIGNKIPVQPVPENLPEEGPGFSSTPIDTMPGGDV